jgi:hypothetical protein
MYVHKTSCVYLLLAVMVVSADPGTVDIVVADKGIVERGLTAGSGWLQGGGFITSNHYHPISPYFSCNIFII